MRMSLRLIVSLVMAVTFVSVAFAIYQVQADNRARRNELEKRAQVLAESLQETVQPLLAKGEQANLERIVERFGNRERLVGVAIYDLQGHPVLTTPNLATRVGQLPALDPEVLQGNGWDRFFSTSQGETYVYAVPVRGQAGVIGALAVFHDASYISAQNASMWRDTFTHILVQMLLIATITLLIVRASMERPISRMAQWLHDLRAGISPPNPDLPAEHVFKPLTHCPPAIEKPTPASAEPKYKGLRV